MNPKYNPCKPNCPRRSADCHAGCPAYKLAAAMNESEKRIQRQISAGTPRVRRKGRR